MNTVSIFKGFNKVVDNKPLSEIIKSIQDGTYKKQVDELRKLLHEGKKEEYNTKKKLLPAFTPSGKFTGGRTIDTLDIYSHYLVLDVDYLLPEYVEKYKVQASQIPFTITAFASPGNQGLKIIVGVDTDAEHHETAYHQVSDYYSQKLNIVLDPKNKDIPRLCFVSYDADLYFNPDFENFKVNLKAAKQDRVMVPETLVNTNTTFEDCVRFTEKKEHYGEGNRNNFIYLLASNCNRKGITEEEALEMISARYDLSYAEIKASIRSAFHHHKQEFGKDKYIPKEIQVNDTEDYLLNSPVIPDQVIETLPDILREGADGFPDVRERDVFITGALCILSGCLPNVTGVYAQRTVYPNLFGFIIAPAASGKGALLSAKNLGDEIHDNMWTVSDQNRKEYEKKLAQYKQTLRSGKKEDLEDLEEPEQPKFNVLYIPANTSNAKVLWHLQQNNGKGVICETEADTMGNVFKQEWGGYSDMLRKAFHHEKVSCSRKTNNEYIEVKEPQLSVALSGTPNQVSNLIQSAEDGLFSRFIFYCFKVDQKWRDVSPMASEINLTTLFNSLSRQVHEMFNFLSANHTEVRLTLEQWKYLNSTFNKWLNQVATFTGDEAGSVVKRLGLVFFRICLLFTAMRKFENADLDTQPYCSDRDFKNALELANVYLEHSLLMFNNLPKQQDQQVFQGSTNKLKFFEQLPQKFKRAEAVEMGLKYKMSTRTVDNLLNRLQPQYLISEEYGSYTKVSNHL